MFAFVLFASIHEMSVIKRISQNLFDLIWLVDFTTFGLYALRVQVVGNICKTTFVLCIHFKDSHHKRSLLLVYLNSFVAFVVVVAKWGIAGVFATPYFLAQASLGILGQIIYIILGLPKSDIEYELALAGIFKPKGLKFQISKFSLVKQVDNLSAVYAVTRQSIGVPRQYAVGFAILYSLQHCRKLRSSRDFGGLLFNNSIYDRKLIIFGKLAEFRKLRLNRQNLFVLNISALASIQDIFVHFRTSFGTQKAASLEYKLVRLICAKRLFEFSNRKSRL